MSDYKRNYLPGGIYFFTLTLRNRKSDLLLRRLPALRNSINREKKSSPLTINAWVVLPDHLHMIWTLPENDTAYSSRWRSIKTLFCKQLGKPFRQNTKVWQPRFWEHTIRSTGDLQNHVHYIHINPVKHGYVDRVIDWPHSSFHHYVDRGILSRNWGADVEIPENLNFGE